MPVVSIPASQELFDYTERVELDGEKYELRFRWNERADSWFVDILDATGTAVIYGRRVSVGSRLTGQHKHKEDLPPGEFLPFDTTQRELDPVVNDLGTRVLLLYFEEAEFADA